MAASWTLAGPETMIRDQSKLDFEFVLTDECLNIDVILKGAGSVDALEEEVKTQSKDDGRMEGREPTNLLLHWGVKCSKAGWRAPSSEELRFMMGHAISAHGAGRTPFYRDLENEGQYSLSMSLPVNYLRKKDVQALPFVLFNQSEKSWFKDNKGSEFTIPILSEEVKKALFPQCPDPSDVMDKVFTEDPALNDDGPAKATESQWFLSAKDGEETRLTAYKYSTDKDIWLIFLLNAQERFLVHWGLCGEKNSGWKPLDQYEFLFEKDNEQPFPFSEEIGALDGSSVRHDKLSRQSPFSPVPPALANGYQHYQMCVVRVPGATVVAKAPVNFCFVLKGRDSNQWIKVNNQDFILGPLAAKPGFHKEAESLLQDVKAKEDEAEKQQRLKAQSDKEFNKVLETFNSDVSIRRKPFDEVKRNMNIPKESVQGKYRRDSKLILLRSASLAQDRSTPQFSVRPLTYKTFTLADGEGQLDVMVSARLLKNPNESISQTTECVLMIELLGCLRQEAKLHWGVLCCSEDQVGMRQRPSDWTAPTRCYEKKQLPTGTVQFDNKAAQSRLEKSTLLLVPKPSEAMALDSEESSSPVSHGNPKRRQSLTTSSIPLRTTTINIPAEVAEIEEGEDGEEALLSVRPKAVMVDGKLQYPWAISLVVKGDDGKWTEKQGGGNIAMTLRPHKSAIAWKGMNRDVPEQCVEAETLWSHITLMHRCNLWHQLIAAWQEECSASPDFRRMTSKRKLSRSMSMISFESSIEEKFKQDVDFWSWFVVWGRMSQVRLLDWQRNYNTKPRDLAGATMALNTRIASIWATFSHSPIRSWVRLFLMILPRGGDGASGQAIRDEILHIMHRHKISEVAGHFFEQWHQKLHNNTTPDDISICKALIAFLRSGGQQQVYLDVLAQEGLTLERMASYDRKITQMPYVPHCDTSHLISDFEKYLTILKNVHDALDVHTSFAYASAHLNDGQRGIIHRAIDLLGGRGVHPTELGHHLSEARRVLHKALKTQKEGSAVRDLLFLDCSLETQQVVAGHALGSREEYSNMRLNDIRPAMNVIIQLLEGAVIHYSCETELKYIISDLCTVNETAIRWQDHPDMFNNESEAALLVLAVIERTSRWLGQMSNEVTELVLPKIKFLAGNILNDADGKNHPEVAVFLDELLRGTFLSAVAGAIQKVDITCRNVADMGSWQCLAMPETSVFNAEVKCIQSLQGLQDQVYHTPTLMVCEIVDGSEDIPEGVVGIVATNSAYAPDMLSHVAVRARNCNVMIVVVHDDKEVESLTKLDGEMRGIEMKPSGQLIIGAPSENVDEDKFKARISSPTKKSTKKVAQVLEKLPETPECKFITADKFDKTKVGGKSFNLEALKAKLQVLKESVNGDIIDLPNAVAFPYGSMQASIGPSAVKKDLETILEGMKPTEPTEAVTDKLVKIAKLIESMAMEPEMEAMMKEIMTSLIPSVGELDRFDTDAESDAQWTALKACWASCFNARPWSAILKSPLDFADLQMSVLVQRVYPSCMSFVLHTADPCGDRNHLVGELVLGLGEVLVGSEPGSAVSWRMDRDSVGSEGIVLKSFASKSSALLTDAANLIFRSDSNSEDREGFAGAGLFESVPTHDFTRRHISYMNPNGNDFKFAKEFVFNKGFRSTLLRQISDIGLSIEKIFEQEMDIEGVVYPEGDHYKIGIVQARPQV